MAVKETKKVNMAQVDQARKKMMAKEVHTEVSNKVAVQKTKEMNTMEEEKEKEEKII
ncbi:unnamed protein product [Trifolium pratense]|uniref:Uncharacterized protein n=1 Tax=Trifolium pratense TaxID=57577 RepID=A0ACB0J1U4_TRIPR|nr:unnamed protein product [Trifolium pratense]